MKKISVITINWNNAAGLLRTLESVATQDSNYFEYLVIDGNSNDGSQDIMAQFQAIIDVRVSEPDKGIYDAMLKGAKNATGEWIWFLNSGDEFADENAAVKMAAYISNNFQLIYGDYLVGYHDGHFCKVTSRD